MLFVGNERRRYRNPPPVRSVCDAESNSSVEKDVILLHYPSNFSSDGLDVDLPQAYPAKNCLAKRVVSGDVSKPSQLSSFDGRL
ncbi:hypothetical protein DPMN_164740 [Dreissena polymorpha]|uniref:Uncharacterized protein n=1 Tax=Dreissena polymorpha TaxID=45954 RepID=A0A9D4IWD1_DREPO|nr:hypothetical protein DPMN_164740 [Dreissena polymorpha]